MAPTPGFLVLALGATSALAQGVPRFGVPMPMRDGVELVGDVWLPDTTGAFPAILIRTPYIRTAQFRRYRLVRYLDHGYAVVLQDTRGRGDSDGTFDFYFPEGRDGYDTVEWIARQPWSNGRVAMDGGSYLGTVQWLAAREHPPHLACIAPTAPSGRLFDALPYQGGAFRLGWALSWLTDVSGRSAQGQTFDLVPWDRLITRRPLLSLDRAGGRRLPLYRAFLTHDTLDQYWRRIHFGPGDFAGIGIPVLHVTGWYDGDQPGALFYWDGMEAHGPRANRFLIIGPWTHAGTYLGGTDSVGAFKLGPESILDIQAERIRFFDSCLKGAAETYQAPRVRIYVTGSNRWLEAETYPLPETRVTPLYLHSGGRANTAAGDGTLWWDAPANEPPDRYTYDPRDPTGTGNVGADHREIEQRPDVLVYSTPPLTEPVEVVGRVFVELVAASDAPDTDFTAKLLDVFPDGRAIKLGPTEVAIRRARYRHGVDRTELLTPGTPETFSIELFDVGHAFLPGHRIRLEISSSAFPYVNPNQNTGNPVATDTVWAVARQTIYHDRERPSRLLLPVFPTGSPR